MPEESSGGWTRVPLSVDLSPDGEWRVWANYEANHSSWEVQGPFEVENHVAEFRSRGDGVSAGQVTEGRLVNAASGEVIATGTMTRRMGGITGVGLWLDPPDQPNQSRKPE
ncbi:MAG: hypothetical protein GY946_24675 [bacterium]|nr:hypothetical protein [bacterium]